MTEAQKKYFDDWIEKYSRLFEFSGSVVFLEKGIIEYRKNIGTANREHNIPISDSTAFRIYSMTKPLTTIGLMLLKDSGKIELDAHPGKYFKGAEWLPSEITLRMLLTHTSGVPDFSKSAEFCRLKTMYPADDNAMIETLKGLPADFAPGCGVNYINTGFFIISKVIEAVSGIEFGEYMREKVFKPLGMNSTYIDSAQKIIPNRAEGYDNLRGKVAKAAPLCIDWMKGAGGAVSTVDDICSFHNAIREKKLISAEAWKEIFTPYRDSFGLGCSVSDWHGSLRYVHNGGYSGFRSLHIFHPNEDFGIIILSNSGFGNSRMVIPEIFYRSYFESNAPVNFNLILDKGFAHNSGFVPEVLKPERPTRFDLETERYIGVYAAETKVYVTKEISNRYGEIICINYPDGRSVCAYPIAENLFFDVITDDSYRFETRDGNVFFEGKKKII